jgi:ERF superfamily
MRTSEKTGAISDAIAKAQAELKNPPKNKINPHFKSRYADLPAIIETILPIYAKFGISIMQGTGVTDTGIILTTRISFKDEWIESDYPVCPFSTPQQQMSALTYAKRAALQVMGLVCGDDDLDGEDSKDVKTYVAVPKITASQVKELENLLIETGSDPVKFQQYFKIKALTDLPSGEFQRAVASLEKKRAA